MEFVYTQFADIPLPTKSFAGQTIIVTGSNIGLGLEAARHFARLDATKVILACRTLSKGEEAARSIHESIGKQGICEVWEIDMGDFESVKAFAKRAAGLDRLDVVVENAGIAPPAYTEIAGMESTIAVNVVGTFLLALNLLPILRSSGRKTGNLPRLTIVSSEMHIWASFKERTAPSIFEELKKNTPRYMRDRYGTSKLLEIFFVRELATHMDHGPHASEPIVVNTVNPGLCHSSLTRDAMGVMNIAIKLLKAAFARTTEVGGRTLVASAVAGQESHGCYMSEARVKEPSAFVRREKGLQKRVYEELMLVLEEIQPGIGSNV